MNIFILDTDIQKCAQYHCDQHVVKMILESVQLLCTALNKKGFDTPYKSTHVNHPSVLWVEASYDNFLWLKQLTLALNTEYKFRYNKHVDHKSITILNAISQHTFPRNGLLRFPKRYPSTIRLLTMRSVPTKNFIWAIKRNGRNVMCLRGLPRLDSR